MDITQQQIRRAIEEKIYGKIDDKRLDAFVASFNQWAIPYGLTTKARVVHYLAQVFHESGCLRYTTELASGAAYDTGPKAVALGNTPEKDGDGQKYKGRGFIQLTGKANYKAFAQSDLCTVDVVKYPEKVADFPLNQMASMWFWQKNKLNELADQDNGLNGEDIVKQITKKVNGGYNHLSERKVFYRRFKKSFFL